MFEDIDLMSSFMASFGLNMILILLLALVFIFAGKPTMTFLKAKILGKNLLQVMCRDGRIDMLTGEYKGGIIRTKKYGDFSVVPKTMLSIFGVKCGLVYESFAGTLPQDFLKDTDRMQSLGLKTYEDINGIKEIMENEKEAISELMKKGKKEKLTKAEEKQMADYGNMLEEYGCITTSINNIQNFFLYDFNPNSVRATINRTVADVVQDYKQFDIMKYAFGFGLFIIFVALAYVMIQSAGGVGNLAAPVAGIINPISEIGAGIQ